MIIIQAFTAWTVFVVVCSTEYITSMDHFYRTFY